jgi:hypothetical protein
MHVRYSSSCLIMSALLAACAEPPSGGDLHRMGVKHASIAAFISANTPKDKLPACLAALPDEEFQSKRFVKLRYRHVKKAINEVAELPPGMDAAENDLLDVMPRDCDKGELTSIVRKLGPSP